VRSSTRHTSELTSFRRSAIPLRRTEVEDAGMKVDYGDGVSALDRTLRSIVMITDAAVKDLESLGYKRGRGGIEIVPAIEGFPVYVHLDGQEVFIVTYGVDDGSLVIKGKWLKKVKKKWWKIFSWFRRLFFR
jgi:hypothetical protein